jgi:hypothetical protein
MVCPNVSWSAFKTDDVPPLKLFAVSDGGRQ